jgi:hypothetical protein
VLVSGQSVLTVHALAFSSVEFEHKSKRWRVTVSVVRFFHSNWCSATQTFRVKA